MVGINSVAEEVDLTLLQRLKEEEVTVAEEEDRLHVP